MSLIEKIREHPFTAATVVAARSVYGWVSENLWPAYSAGAVISALCILAVSHEKQMLADHLYGNNKQFTQDNAEIVTNAGKLLDEEISYGIKHDVFTLSKAAFEREYTERR